MQSNIFKSKKGKRSSESEKDMEIRIYNSEQWIFLALKIREEMSNSEVRFTSPEARPKGILDLLERSHSSWAKIRNLTSLF